MQSSDLAFQKEIRKALSHFHDFIYLRSCPLAHALPLSAYLSAGDRAWALQRLLREAVEHLRPPGTPSDGDRRWRPYHILHYVCIEELSRQEVMDRLAISSATFHREKGKGIAAVCCFLRERERDLRALPVSPWPIPRIEHFVGRETELDACRRRLEEEHATVIAGPAGVGKTSLGAELAAGWQARGHSVVWVSFHEGQNTNLETLLETIALSLATLGQDACWRFLQAERRKMSPLSLESRVRYLLTFLEQEGCLFCLDNFELVNKNKAINSLCTDLLRSARRGKTSLLVMSRVTPRFTREYLCKSLRGLCREDARRLLELTGLPALPETLFAELYARTAGVPIFLKLFAAWAYSQGLEKMESEETRQTVAFFVKNMMKEQIVNDYLLHQVYETLGPQERCFLTCASVFRTTFDVEQEPIIALLMAEGVTDIEVAWTSLVNRHIFTSLEWGDNVTLHPLVQEYFRHQLRMNSTDWTRIHRRVGGYYEETVGDVLEAGYHYFEAREYERAARLLSENVTQLINVGQAEAALGQLERLTRHLARTAGAELRFEVAAAREALCHLLGRREKQKGVLDTMLALAEEPGDERRLAVAYNRWARFREATGDYPAAIAAAEAGQATARRAGDRHAEVESLNLWGRALWHSSEYAAAQECGEQALALARETGDRRGEAVSLDILGVVSLELGNYIMAQDYHEQTLVIHRAIGDQHGEAVTLNKLGIACSELGEYVAALSYYQQVLTICQAIGAQRGTAIVLGNLGGTYHYLGDYTAARDYYKEALTINCAIGDRRSEVISLYNLGEVYTELGDHFAARVYEEQALALAREIGDRRQASYALTYLGRLLEELGDLGEAEAAYCQALIIRREIGQPARAIDDVAGLGRVALARSKGQEAGWMEEANQYAEECLAHIAVHGVTGIEYPFEVYLTCVRILEACGEHKQARAVLEEAYALLMEWADKISDGALRRSFLENVPAHRALLEAREELWKTGADGLCHRAQGAPPPPTVKQ